MAFQVQITSLQQLPPITSTTATVALRFTVTGVRPDFAQVYALTVGETDPGGQGDLVDQVDLSITESDYYSQFNLLAGMIYRIAVCPRTGSKDNPEDKIDGVYWESYCVYAPITTQAYEGNNARIPPHITELQPQPYSLTHPAQIVVSWQSQPYDKFLIWWTENGVPMAQGEVDSSGSSGSWAAGPVTPGAKYTFSVKGGVSGGIFGNYLYSDWSPAVPFVAPANLRSLRQFLLASGVNPAKQTVRPLMKGQPSVKRFMQI